MPGSQAELGGGIQITTGRTQAGSPTWPLTREMGSGHKPGAGSLETQTRSLRDNCRGAVWGLWNKGEDTKSQGLAW